MYVDNLIIEHALMLMDEEGVSAVGYKDGPLIHRGAVYEDELLAKVVIRIIKSHRKWKASRW